MTPEFDLIARHFTRPVSAAKLGVGDDCALFSWVPGRDVAVSTDTLVAGVHFFVDADAQALGHKALAVNLSDLAAMGAAPKFVTLALTLPQIDHQWLAAFARGFYDVSNQFGVELIGGDTTRGPLSMTLTVIGEADPNKVLRRDRAHEGDDVWISGDLGGASLALRHLRGEIQLSPGEWVIASDRLHRPLPRVGLGLALRGLAHAAIDISDGLLADLGHICERSMLSATLDWQAIPRSPSLGAMPEQLQMDCALAGGDDYELCFAAAPQERAAIEAAGRELSLPLARVGSMQSFTGTGSPVEVLDASGKKILMLRTGYDHFAGATA